MKTSPDDLAAVLQQWRADPPADPDFRTAVWRRLAKPAAMTWPAYLRMHLAVWTVAAVVLLVGAGVTGRALAEVRLRADREAMVVTYLTELDPRVQAVLRP